MKKLLILAALAAALLVCPEAHAQLAQRASTLQNAMGRAVPQATITVCAYNSSQYALVQQTYSLTTQYVWTYTGPVPCTPTVTIYNDPGGAHAITPPLLTSGNGNYSYWITAGAYTECVAGTQIVANCYVVNVGGTGGGSSGLQTFTTSANETATLPNSVEWGNGTNSTVNLSTPGKISIDVPGLSGFFTPHSILLGNGTGTFNVTCASPLSGQILTAINGADPQCLSPGIPNGNNGVPVTTSPYPVQCDSASTLIDRGTTIVFQSGASVITVPNSASCGSHMYFTLIDDGAGTLTINRSGSDTFSITNGSSNTDGATTATLTNGQSATLNNGTGTTWNVRTTTTASGVTNWSGDGIVACNVNSTGAVSMFLCPTPPNFIIAGPPSAGSSNLVQSASTSTGTNGAPITVTLPNPVKAGDLLVTVVSSGQNRSTTDTSGDTFTTNFVGLGDASVFIGYTCNAIGGAETFTTTATAAFYGHIQVYEFTGNPTSNCLDTLTSGTQTGGSAFSIATSGGVAQATELIFGALQAGGGGLTTNIFAGSGETALQQNITSTSSPGPPQVTRSVIQNLNTGLSGIQTVQATADQLPSNWAGFVAAFKLNSTGNAPLTARPAVCGDIPAHSPCPVYNSTRTAQTSAISDSVMFVTTSAGLFRFTGTINCTTTSASATATLNLKYTDTGNVAQTVPITDTCTSLVTSGIPNINVPLRVKSGTNITWGVTIANTPTYDVDVRLDQLP